MSAAPLLPGQTKRFARLRALFRPTWPTRLGALFLLLILVIGGSAILFSNNLFYLVVAMMLAFFVASGVVAEYTISRLSGRLTTAPEVFARRPCSLILELSNGKTRFPSFGLTVRHHEDGPWGRDRLRLMHLPAGASLAVTWATEWPRRGWVRIAGVWIATRFPFCMWEKATFVRCDARVLVFPAPALPPALPTDAAAAAGNLERTVRGAGLSVVSLREYVPGDSYRLIHWKRSAKTGQLETKEMEQETERAVTVVLAVASGQELEPALSVACGILLDLDAQGVPFGLVTHAGALAASHGKPHLRAALARLALLPEGPADWLPTLGEVDRWTTRPVIVHAEGRAPAWADPRLDSCVPVAPGEIVPREDAHRPHPEARRGMAA